MWVQILVIFIVVTFLIGCDGGGSGATSSVGINEATIERESSETTLEKISINYQISSLYNLYENNELPPVVPIFNENQPSNAEGVFSVRDINSGETKEYRKNFFIDLYTFEITNQESLELIDGEYEISLELTFQGKEYFAKAVGTNNFYLNLSPKVGDENFKEVKIDYFTTDLFYKTKFISLGTENEEVFYRVNSESFLRTVYVSEEFTTIKFYDEDDVFFTSSLENLEVLVKE